MLARHHGCGAEALERVCKVFSTCAVPRPGVKNVLVFVSKASGCDVDCLILFSLHSGCKRYGIRAEAVGDLISVVVNVSRLAVDAGDSTCMNR